LLTPTYFEWLRCDVLLWLGGFSTVLGIVFVSLFVYLVWYGMVMMFGCCYVLVPSLEIEMYGINAIVYDMIAYLVVHRSSIVMF
jgi:hypothetical protein